MGRCHRTCVRIQPLLRPHPSPTPTRPHPQRIKSRPLQAVHGVMVVARLQKVSVYAAGFLVAFRRRVWGDLKKVHPPRNQIYRVVENVPLNVLECHVSMVNSVVQNSGNTTIRTVVLGDQHSIDELLSLQEFDPLAFGSCRLVPAGEVCGVTPPTDDTSLSRVLWSN